jgi:hypothetical protein
MTNPIQTLFSFDYFANINDPMLELNTVKFPLFDPMMMLAYGPNHILILLRSLPANTLVTFKTFAFEGILNAEFMPLSVNCIGILSAKDFKLHFVNWQSSRANAEEILQVSPYPSQIPYQYL